MKYVDHLSSNDLREQYPELAHLDLVEPDIVDDGEELSSIKNGTLDFIIANHFIEHCENPIGALLNFYAKLKSGGVVYLAVPDKRFTFDRERASTSVEHLESDHHDGGVDSRSEHYLDYARHALSNGSASELELEELAGEMMEAGYSIHFHVWTYDEFFDLLRWLKVRHLEELEVVEARPNRKEGIFILRKQVVGPADDAVG